MWQAIFAEMNFALTERLTVETLDIETSLNIQMLQNMKHDERTLKIG